MGGLFSRCSKVQKSKAEEHPPSPASTTNAGETDEEATFEATLDAVDQTLNVPKHARVFSDPNPPAREKFQVAKRRVSIGSGAK